MNANRRAVSADFSGSFRAGLVALSVLCLAVPAASGAGTAECAAVPGGDELRQARCLAEHGAAARAWLLLRRLPAERLTAEDAALRERLAHSLGLAPPTAAAEDGARLERHAFVALAHGHDSNITRGTDLAEIAVPMLPGRSIALPVALTATGSHFLQVESGGSLRRTLTPAMTVYGNAALLARLHSRETGFAPWDGRLAAGAEIAMGGHRLHLEANAVDMHVARYMMMTRRALRTAGEFAAGGPLAAFLLAESGEQRYPFFMDVSTHGTTYAAGIASRGGGFGLALAGGTERSGGAVKDLDRRHHGWSLHGMHDAGAAGVLRARLAFTYSRYDLASSIFLARRNERLDEWRLEWSKALGAGWSVALRWQGEHDHSSLELTRYDRRQWLAAVRKDF